MSPGSTGATPWARKGGCVRGTQTSSGNHCHTTVCRADAMTTADERGHEIARGPVTLVGRHVRLEPPRHHLGAGSTLCIQQVEGVFPYLEQLARGPSRLAVCGVAIEGEEVVQHHQVSIADAQGVGEIFVLEVHPVDVAPLHGDDGRLVSRLYTRRTPFFQVHLPASMPDSSCYGEIPPTARRLPSLRAPSPS
jgi:hypothetical protein